MAWFKKDPLQIIPFKTYGTEKHMFLKGRAIEDENINLSQKGLLKLLVNSWKRFETDEIKNTSVSLSIAGRIIETSTDNKGYYTVAQSVSTLAKYADTEGWVPYTISYTDEAAHSHIQQNNQFNGEILVPPSTAKFGVISDVDDTIIHTGVASFLKWRLLLNTLFKKAEKRVPLEGAASFYEKLHEGVKGNEGNPIFYISHSPWNLYRYLHFFLKKNNFPKGPILLRSFPNFFKRKQKGEKPQKQHEIINVLETYPALSFVLIGDSGEHDATIYTEIAKQYPDRILAIYLRSVKHKRKMLRIQGLFKTFKTTPALLVKSSTEAEEHARKLGLIY